MADESPETMLIERLAYEAMQWAKANNVGADQPSLVFARRFAFLLSAAGQSLTGKSEDGSSQQNSALSSPQEGDNV